MKAKLLAAAFLAASAAACSPGGQMAVLFRGTTPATAAVKDTRAVQIQCPVCGTVLQGKEKVCTNKQCQAKLTTRDQVACGFCGGTGECPTCRMMKQVKGKCYNCGGSGTLVLMGKTVPCPNCKGKGTCPTCGGNNKCDWCGGGGKVDMSKIIERAAAAQGGSSDEEPKK